MALDQECIPETDLFIKGAQSYFSNFWQFWYHRKAHIFLITHVKFYSPNMLHLEDINENMSDYGNHN